MRLTSRWIKTFFRMKIVKLVLPLNGKELTGWWALRDAINLSNQLRDAQEWLEKFPLAAMGMKYSRASFVDASAFPAFCARISGTTCYLRQQREGGVREGDWFWNRRRVRCRDSHEEVCVQVEHLPMVLPFHSGGNRYECICVYLDVYLGLGIQRGEGGWTCM